MRRNYADPAYQQARKACLKRDRRSCQMPQCGSKRKLVCHHIERWADAHSLRYEVSNLITLCKVCHDSIKNSEGHYASLFKSILASKR